MNQYKLQMKSQELFQIDREIGQIRKGIEQRQEKMAEWNVPLIRVLQPSCSPDQYLQKKYPKAHISFYQTQNQGTPDEAKHEIQRHLSESRMRIRKHRNELKELDQLIKKRSVIRVLKLKENKENQSVKLKNNISTVQNSSKKEMSRTYDGSEKMFPRPQKERPSIMNMKGEKLLEMYQQRKSRGVSGEQAAIQLKRQLGLGLENTPFYMWMQKKGKQQPLMKAKSKKKLKIEQKHQTYPFFKTIENDVQMPQLQIRPKKEIYLKQGTNLAENFQRRLLKIMRYHQNTIDKMSV